MKKFQKDIDEFVSQFEVPYWKPLEIMARLTEETGELARELNHRFGPKKKKSSEDVKEVGDEIGDILFTLGCLANSLHINLDECMTRTIDKAYKRDNNRFSRKDS